jgi:quercetin dioxygenase-like cupin family protein
MKTARIILMAALIAATSSALSAASPPLTRTTLQQHDLSMPGHEMIQVLVGFPPGAIAAKHKHPGEEIIYVLEGALEYTIGDQPPVMVKAGEVTFVPAGVPHSARNIGPGHASELATYVVEKGKPLVVPVK